MTVFLGLFSGVTHTNDLNRSLILHCNINFIWYVIQINSNNYYKQVIFMNRVTIHFIVCVRSTIFIPSWALWCTIYQHISFIYVSLLAAQARWHIFMGFIKKKMHILLYLSFEALGLNISYLILFSQHNTVFMYKQK